MEERRTPLKVWLQIVWTTPILRLIHEQRQLLMEEHEGGVVRGEGDGGKGMPTEVYNGRKEGIGQRVLALQNPVEGTMYQGHVIQWQTYVLLQHKLCCLEARA